MPGLALGLLIRALRPLDIFDMLAEVLYVSVSVFFLFCLAVYGIEEKSHLMPYI